MSDKKLITKERYITSLHCGDISDFLQKIADGQMMYELLGLDAEDFKVSKNGNLSKENVFKYANFHFECEQDYDDFSIVVYIRAVFEESEASMLKRLEKEKEALEKKKLNSSKQKKKIKEAEIELYKKLHKKYNKLKV